MIEKVKRHGILKLENNIKDGILLHGYLAGFYFERFREPKIGLSMNDRKHFSKQEWINLYNEGIKIFEAVEKEKNDTKISND